MSALRQLGDLFTHWIDAVTAAVTGMLGRFGPLDAVEVNEEEDGSFVIQKRGGNAPSGVPFERVQIANGQVTAAHPESVEKMLRGARAAVTLKASRFLFRPLELPQRAAEFIDGVVRAQIDRLTPWSATDAAFGWSKPAPSGSDRISVTVAATARAMVQPYVQALMALGAQSVAVATLMPGAEPTPIRVLEQKAAGALDGDRVRRMIVIVLGVAALAAAGAMTASTVMSASLGARQDELARRIAERRALIRSGRERADLATTPQRALERRKYEVPATVLVLDAVSQILPDHTYVIELRIEGDKLRITGLTRDAPGLIRQLEQNPMFTRATFFAPTTRAPTDPGERFHIEARIEPVLAPRS